MFHPINLHAAAWQPLTPRGAAAFAFASWRRLMVVQLLAAFAAAGIVSWILAVHWFPSIRTAIRRLPEQGRIYNGRLEWHGGRSQVLAEGNFLAVSVDLDHLGTARVPSHLLIEFGRADLQIHSVLGYYASWPYPAFAVPFNRPALDPWWGAWSPILLGAVAGIVVIGLLLSWALLATLYAPVVWLAGLYGNRELGPLRSWKLAGAALMPGAVLEMAILAGYGMARLDLVQFLAATAAHILVGWVFLFLCPFFLPRASSPGVLKGNPFVASPAVRADPDPNRPLDSR